MKMVTGLGRTFTSRPDNVVVQWLTAPEGKTMNVSISLEKSAGVEHGFWDGLGCTTGNWNHRSGYDCIQAADIRTKKTRPKGCRSQVMSGKFQTSSG